MKTNWWKSLQIKIITWSFIPTMIILSAVAWFTFYSYQKVLGDLTIKQYPEIVQPKSQAFSDAVGNLFRPTLLPIYLEIDTQPELPIEVRAQNILDQAQGLEIFDGGIYFLDQRGIVFKTQPEQPQLIGIDWSDSPHFRSINATPNFSATTDLITIEPSGKKIFCAATAMTGKAWDELVGAFYLCFTVFPATQNVYYQDMLNLDLGSNLYVLDRNQQIVFSAEPSEMGRDLSGEDYVQQLSQSDIRSGRFRVGSEDFVVSYVPIGGTPSDRASWFVMTKQNWAEIMQPSLPYRYFLYALLVLGVVVPALVTAYGVRHITDPLHKLIQVSERVTAGHFKHLIKVNTGDEIESLANQFNLMTKKLDESYSSLEKKVADRTRELAIMNSIISVASHSLDIQEILKEALNETVEQMNYDAGIAFRFEPQQPIPLLVAQQGLADVAAIDYLINTVIKNQGSPRTYPREVIAFENKKIQDEELNSQLSLLGFQLYVYIPLSTKSGNLGFFIMMKQKTVSLSTEEQLLMSSIGKQLGVAMENARLYEQVEQTAIASERQRLARELHDAVTQTLFSANLVADVLPEIWKKNPQEGMQNLEELRQLTRGALAEMRTMLLEMRPESLQQSDIKSLLSQLADAFIGRVRIPLDIEINGDCALTNEVKIVFFRVAQEALNNIAKHSGARHVELYLDCQADQLKLLIKDDGLGFDPGSITTDHLGIEIMRERASSIGASLQIKSQLGQGTTIEMGWKSTQEA